MGRLVIKGKTNILFWKFGRQSPNDAAKYPTKTKASATPQREPKSLNNRGNERQNFSKAYELMHGWTDGQKDGIYET
jgi:hypothetical protein